MSDQEWSDQLREPFAPAQIGKLPRAGIQLDDVGHGAVTARLLAVDPLWSWEPMALENGLPLMERDDKGNPITLWIRLTVKGVSRLGVGTCPSGQRDAEKVLIGDAIRNAAMRFGVALDLWIRGQGEDDEQKSAGQTANTNRKPRTISKENGEALIDKCAAAGVPSGEVVKLGTGGRTSNPFEVTTAEITAVKEALENLTPKDSAA